jgi:hypothetical protein
MMPNIAMMKVVIFFIFLKFTGLQVYRFTGLASASGVGAAAAVGAATSTGGAGAAVRAAAV